MNLVDKNGYIFDTTGFIYFDHGTCGDVYRNGNVLLKYYYADRYSKYYFLDKDVFKIIKNIDCRYIAKLYDYYYEKKSKMNKFLLIDAYTMNLVKKEDINLFEVDEDYIYKIVDQLLESAYLLAYSHIGMLDTDYKNMVFNKNGVNLIDVDMYYYSKLSSISKMYEKNKKAIYYYLVDKLDYDNLDKKYDNYDKVRRLIKKECKVIDNRY